MNENRREVIAAWCRGYRQLMVGGLDETVHTAGTSLSEVETNIFADLRVSDVESLLIDLRVAEVKVSQLLEALNWTEANFEKAVNGKPVRDIDENLSFNATVRMYSEPTDGS